MDRNGHPVGCLFRLGNRVDTGGVAACALGVLVRVVPNLGTGVVPGKGRVWLPGGGRHVGCFVPPLSCAKMCAFTQSDTPISEGRIRCYPIIAGNLRWQPIGPDAGRRSLWAVIRSAVSATCGQGRDGGTGGTDGRAVGRQGGAEVRHELREGQGGDSREDGRLGFGVGFDLGLAFGARWARRCWACNAARLCLVVRGG